MPSADAESHLGAGFEWAIEEVSGSSIRWGACSACRVWAFSGVLSIIRRRGVVETKVLVCYCNCEYSR